MTRSRSRKKGFIRMSSLPVLAAFAILASAESVKVEGLIVGRSGATMILKTSNSPNQLVLLTDTTQVGQVQGMLQARKKEMSMAALIPGLAVKVEGTYDSEN